MARHPLERHHRHEKRHRRPRARGRPDGFKRQFERETEDGAVVVATWMRQLCHPRGSAVGEQLPTVGGEREYLGVERLIAEAARCLHL